MAVMASSRNRRWFLLGLVTVVAIFIAVIPGKRGWFDVGVYFGTIHHWVEGGLLYDYVKPESHYGFTYPPFAAICMLPMLLFTWHQAVAVSVLLTTLASAALIYWLVDPIAQRQGWNRGFTFVVAACMFAMLEPVRDTVSFGQVNLLLLALVFVDYFLLTTGREKYAGIGIGLASAIKLTPAIFIIYLLLTRRKRAAGVATGTAVTATLLAAQIAPTESLIFWTDALWDTNRVGVFAYVSNQSLQGVLSRLAPPTPGTIFWALATIAVIWVWIGRLRKADDRTGFALTGIVATLISPITWVHHLVWLIPALVVMADAALLAGPAEKTRMTKIAIALYAALCSSVVWLWSTNPSGVYGLVGSNTYVWVGLILFFMIPATTRRSVTELPPLELTPRLALRSEFTLHSRRPVSELTRR
jgi:alpha-1,2-mannosyltransferase